MFTIRGEMPESALRKEQIIEDVPCGKSVTTKFFAQDGELVRQDIEIQARLEMLGAATGDWPAAEYFRAYYGRMINGDNASNL